MILKLKSILPNPFRDLKSNPLLEDKVKSLVDSINLTGFWDNVVVRKNADGNYELAYGHHRLAAAIRAGIVEADFIIKKFTDAQMIQVMDSENRETYGTTPQSVIESVKAVVQSLSKRVISPFNINPKTNTSLICYAPAYAPDVHAGVRDSSMAYTAKNIAEFLGRSSETAEGYEKADKSITAALLALHLQSKGRFSESMLKKKDETGNLVSITLRELHKRTADVKRDMDATAARVAKTKEEVAKADEERRRAIAEMRARQGAEEKRRKELQKKELEAEREENIKKAKELKAKIAAETKAAEEKAVLDKIRISEIDAKVVEAKKKAEEQKKVDDYLPTKREVIRILHKLEGSTATTKEALAEEVKALVRQPLNNTDREQLRQAALNLGTWLCEWVAMQFLPPISVKKQMSAYRSREESRRRAEEAEAERKRIKQEKKEKNGKAK